MNIYGVKEGDIFCLERSGTSGCHAEFFQVTSLRGTKQVVIKEVKKEEVERGLVKPSKDNFKEYSFYLKNNIGIKNVRKRDEKREYEDSDIYITFNRYYYKNYYDEELIYEMSWYDEAYLWKGEAKKDLLEWLD